MTGMLRFYWRLLVRVPMVLFNATDLILTTVAVAAFLLAAFNQAWAKQLVKTWEGFSPWWSLVPVGLVALYGVAKANYEFVATVQASLVDERLARRQVEDRAAAIRQRRMAAARIAEHMAEGNALHERVSHVHNPRPPKALQDDVNDWETRTYASLQREFPEFPWFAEHFKREVDARQFAPPGQSLWLSHLLRLWIEQKQARLSEILMKLDL